VSIAYAVVAILLAVALVGSGMAKLTRQPRVVEGVGDVVGVPMQYCPVLAALEFAGAAGLIIGLWVPALGVAAGIGVVLYFLGAVVAHLRVGDHDLAAPIGLALIAVAAVVLRLVSQ
jgi:hypothetical protein